MLNRNFLRKIKIDNILKYLELATKLVAIIMIVATIIGGLNIYSYLKDINHLFLFSDVVGISYASVSALISYFLFVLVVSLGFLSPFIIPVFLLLISNNNEYNNQENKTPSNNSKSVFNPSRKLLVFTKNIKKLLLYPVLCIIPIFTALGVAVLPIIIMILLICYLPIYVLNFSVRELFFGKERYLSFIILSEFVHWVSFLCVIGITLIVFFGNGFSEYLLYCLTLIFVIVSFLYTMQFFKNIQNQKVLNFEKFLSIILLSIISVFPAILYFMFVIYPTVNIVKYEIAFILFYFFSILLFGLSCFTSYIFTYDYFFEKKFYYEYNISLIFINIILIFVYTIYLSYFSAYNISLHPLRFIEKPQNSSWYIIHNGNTASETINGMTKDEIKYRQQFFIPNSWQQYCKDDIFDSINMQNCTTLRNENALYGYMAWNLGNAKVFCPQSVDFFRTDNQNERNVMSQKCLVINGKYLQLVSEYYLKQPTNQ